MSVTLRDYQHDALDRVRDAYRSGARAPLLVLPTGGGKTVCFSAVVSSAAQRGNSALVMAHRRELVRQASAKLSDAGVPHGIIAPGFSQTADIVQVGSIQTLGRRTERLRRFDLIIPDEAHHATAGQWKSLIQSQPDAKLLGVTATPERLDGKGLGVECGGPFDALVVGTSVNDLMDDGYLVTAHVLAPSEAPDLSRVATVRGDFSTAGLEAAMGATLTGDAVKHYAKYADGLPAIAFCTTVAHARDVAETFRAAGYRAVAADGTTPTPIRDAAIAGLASGSVQVLCTCDLISEGLDVPAVSAVILLRPTQSLGLFLQQVGRGLRCVYAPGDYSTRIGRLNAIAGSKKPRLIVLDHAGNTLRHGLIETVRDWTLEGRKARAKKDTPPPTWRCFRCFAVQAPAQRCRDCGTERPAGEIRRLNQVEGELVAVDPARAHFLRAEPLAKLLKAATTDASLREIAKARGYKPGWVFHQKQEMRRAR